MRTVTTDEPRTQGVQQHGYRGRVRSGCLTCRSRKVKCDEKRPICDNCTRLKRDCAYKPRKSQQSYVTILSPQNSTSNESIGASGTKTLPEASTTFQHLLCSPTEEENCAFANTLALSHATDTSRNFVQDSFLFPDGSLAGFTAHLDHARRRQNELSITINDAEFDAASTATLISRDIKITTTMDKLTARAVGLQPSFSFFVESVDCPSITPYDGVNWRFMKLEVVELAKSNSGVSSAVLAVSALHKAHLYGLPLCKALSLYRASRSAYEKLLTDAAKEFDTILAATFLLCLFEFHHYETVPMLREPSEVFVKMLRNWAQHQPSHSGLSLRIVAWIQLLHSTTLRGGGMGLVSDNIWSLFPNCKAGIPNLHPPPNHDSDTSTHLYEVLSTPIFEFHFQLQMISGDIAKLTHYHRSRITGTDQEEVLRQLTSVKSRLNALWESRSATQRQTPEDLRSHLSLKIAKPIIALIGVCTAAYHAEFVEIDRVMGDPVSESTGSKRAMCRMREIIDGDWNSYDEGKLNPGFLRPLFLYAIECNNREENHWAIAKLKEIKKPIYRSDFFAAFAAALSDAQLRKERRVTSKYFCIWYFGEPPPYL